MAKKIERTTTLAEAAKQLGATVPAVTNACKACGIDLSDRSPKHLKGAELAQIKKHLTGGSK